ncbi:eCIS core domain-containing protein, partial [Actinacidiphila bryophytorum]
GADGEPSALRQAERGAAPDALLAKAAASGRADVLGSAGWLRLQRTLGNGAVAAMAEEESPVHAVVGGGGSPLEPEVRGDMEARLGADFGDVRVHTDAAAHESAQAVNAHAYTVGSHVVFQRDAYDPGSHQGRTTLAHELTHVVQQRSGPVEGTEAGGGVRVSDPSDRFEQEAAATAARVVQREEEPVEEEAPAE